MRTLALLLVATYHVWFGRVSGGVDIFLLISAFLLTRSLYGRIEQGKPLRPLHYIVQRFGRIAPLAVAIAAMILVACAIVLPLARFSDHLDSFIASAFYFENVRLQTASVDYLAGGISMSSPFQHYWSLSIQGQIFIIWPLILLAISLIHRQFKVPLRPLALAVFGSIFLVGLGWSIVFTIRDQPLAYFDLYARAWEFAAGSVLALILPWLRFKKSTRAVLTWTGIGAAVLCGIVLPVDATFPGIAALWPVTAAALVIMGAGAPTQHGGDRLLTNPIMTRVGDYTYALYLVHWPVLIFGVYLMKIERPDFLQGSVLLIISALLSAVAVHLIEKPFAWATRTRTKSGDSWLRAFPWRAAIVIIILALLSNMTHTQGHKRVEHNTFVAKVQLQDADLASLGPNAPNAAIPDKSGNVIPSLWIAGRDLGWLVGCESDALPDGVSDDASDHCQSNIDDINPADAERNVYVVGNSHAQQLTQLVDEAAEDQGWAIRAYLKFGCQFPHDGNVDAACEDMWDDATVDILASAPDVVFVMASQSQGPDSEIELTGLVDWIDEITSAGIPVIALRDNPRSALNPVDCLAQWGFDSDACTWQSSLSEPNESLQRSIEAVGATYLDFNQLVCPEGVCAPVRGGVLVFFDVNHVSATYMRALAYTTAPQLAAALPWWPSQLGT